MNLTKESIAAAQDIPAPEVFSVPEWGGDVHLCVMSGTERDAFDAENNELNKTGKGLENIRARMLVRCICDEHGGRLFSNDEAGQLGQKAGHVLDRLFDEARKINHYGEENLAELEKNSDSARNA
jgi:hypothetical protein